MSVAIGASAAGARAYTATASQGLLFMAEAVFNAAGMGLPIVMTVANRAIGAPINIWNDHTDSMSQRDCGWIQLFAETNQEALDLHIQAFRLAEELSVPVMVCMDGFTPTPTSASAASSMRHDLEGILDRDGRRAAAEELPHGHQLLGVGRDEVRDEWCAFSSVRSHPP